MANWFYISNGVQMGPVPQEQLASLGVNASTPVWTEGMANWLPAGQVPQLAGIFAQQAQAWQQPAWQQPDYQTLPPQPDNYLVWGILVTLFCCLPLGIVSIVKSSQVSSHYAAGNYDAAVQASKSAKKWAIWGAVGGVAISVIYLLFYVIVGSALMLGASY